MQIYESDEFRGGPDSEQRILYFTSAKGGRSLYPTFDEFIKACILYELRLDNAYGTPMPIGQLQKQSEIAFKTEVAPLAPRDFLQNKALRHFGLTDVLLQSHMAFPETILSCAAIYPQEWNYLFHAAETETAFYAFNWFTSA